MYFTNIFALFVLNLVCFYAAYKSIEISQQELSKITRNETRLKIHKWLSYTAFVIQTTPWVGIWIGYAINKNNYHVSVIENLWPLTRLSLFCVLFSLFLISIPIMLGEDKEYLKNLFNKPRK